MSLQIKIKGLHEVIAKLDKMPDSLRQTERIVVAEAAKMVANEMRKNAHVVTGRMRSSIREGYVGTNTANVIVGVPYAAYENRRLGTKAGFGTHDFADRAIQSTKRELDELVRISMTEIFNQ